MEGSESISIEEEMKRIPNFKAPHQVKYPRARIKEAIKFTRFYFKHFKPISQMEFDDQKSSKRLYNVYTTSGGLALLMASVWIRSYNIRRQDVTKFALPNRVSSMFNDIVFGILGYTLGQVLSVKWIYDQRDYVRDRL